MPDDLQVTKALRDGLEEHAPPHIRESVRAARAAYDVDPMHFGLGVFGYALHKNLRERFVTDLARGDTPFSTVQTNSNYPVPTLEHGEFGQIAILHHRVDAEDHLPKRDSGELLRKHVSTGQKDLFGGRRQATVRLLGIVGTPMDGFQEAFVGKVVPTTSGTRRLEHQKMLDLGDGGSHSRGDGGISQDGPDPESVDTPDVTREQVVTA
jgi:hypothetical protein